MRLNRLRIEEFRGIRCTEFEFSDEGILIYGPNGVGKSSTLIALEYLLTGTVARLTGEGAGREALERDLVHKKANSREESKVTAEFSHHGETVEIRRCVADGELELINPKSDVPMALADLTAAVENQQNILSRHELLRFINATDSDRSAALNSILRIEAIDNYRMTLQRVRRNAENTLKRADSDMQDSKEDFYSDLSGGLNEVPTTETRSIASDKSALEAINEFREYYDASPLQELGKGNFTKNIREPAEPIQHPLSSKTTVTKLEEAKQFLGAFDDQILTPLKEMHELVNELRGNTELRRDVETQSLLEQGEAIVTHDSTQCPLCLSEYDGSELLQLIDERQENADDAMALQRHIRDQQQSIEATLDSIVSLLNQVLRDLSTELPDGAADLNQYIKILKQLSENLDSFVDSLTSGDLLKIPHLDDSRETIRAELLPEGLETAIDDLLEIAERVEEPEDQFAAYSHLNRAEFRYEQYIEDAQTKERLTTREQIARQLESEFQSVRQQLLNETLEEIQTQLDEILNLTASELTLQDNYKLESTETGIEFRVPFHDGSTQRPNQIFSEGQQDIVGLSLFLAMANVACVDSVEIIILDDVLSSVDAEHRSHVARILDTEIGERFQFVLTTHDLVWSRHLRQSGHVGSENVIHLSGWSYEAGVHRHHDITDPQKNIEFHLKNNDLTAAAAWGRKTAEFYASKGCEELNTKIRYNKIEQLSLSDYLHSLMPVLVEILNDGTVDGDTIYDEGKRDEIVERFGKIQTFIDQNHWGMNKNVHYSEPEYASYSEPELRENLAILDDLSDVLYCSCCDTWRKNHDEGFGCDCSILVKNQ